MTTAYSYIRMSTAIQLDGTSKDRQLQMTHDYAQKHGLILDESLKLEDIGMSAYKGKHIGDGGKLKLFLDLLEEGVIEKGSYLLIESLDRLSRAKVMDALTLLNQILSHGITVVTLSDGMKYTTESIGEGFNTLMYSLMIMSRAHEESKQKAQRLSAAWSIKRDNIGQQKLTSLCPQWLELSDDRTEYLEIKENVEVVQRIFQLAKDGSGSHAIVRILNEQKVPLFEKAAKRKGRKVNGWHQSYITKILKSKAVIGEYQLNKMIDGKRTPVGEPIADYFPRVISEEDFYLVQSLRKSRRSSGGRHGLKLSNLFSRLIICGECGSSVRYVNKGKKPKGGQYLICSSKHLNAGCECQSWKYQEFEDSFIKFISEVDVSSALVDNDEPDNKLRDIRLEISACESRYDNITQKLEKLVAALLNYEGTTPDSLLKPMTALENEKEALADKIASLKSDEQKLRREKEQVSSCITDIVKLKQQLQGIEDTEIYRRRLTAQSRIQQLVDKIVINFNGSIALNVSKEPSFKEMFSVENRTKSTLRNISASRDTKAGNEYEDFGKQVVPVEALLSYEVYFKNAGVRTVYFGENSKQYDTMKIDTTK